MIVQTKSIKKIGLILFIFTVSSLLLEAKSVDYNQKIADLVEEIESRCISTKYPNSSVVLLPISSQQQRLTAVCQLFTGLISSQMSKKLHNRFQLASDLKISITNGMLSTYQLKRCTDVLDFQILLTGDVREVNNTINLNLFVWDAKKEYVVYFTSLQLNKSISLDVLSYEKTESIEPYYLKWQGRPHLQTYYTAIAVSDIDGNGLNELVLSDGIRLDVMIYEEYGFWKLYSKVESFYSKVIMLAADNNSNHYDELYVAVQNEGTKVFEWKNSELEFIAKHEVEFPGESSSQRDFMIVARNKSEFIATYPLTAKRDYFSGEKTLIFRLKDSKIESSKPCPIPVDYHSIAFNFVDNTSEPKCAVIDEFGHLRIYKPDLLEPELIYQSLPVFGKGIAVGDLDSNGINEIVTTSGKSDQYDKFFIIEWDNGLYTKKWESPQLDGQIADLVIADADNDDNPELLVCIQKESGTRILLYSAISR